MFLAATETNLIEGEKSVKLPAVGAFLHCLVSGPVMTVLSNFGWGRY